MTSFNPKEMARAPSRGNTPANPEAALSPGTFREGCRLTTPCGHFMLPPRPVSQLAVRMRGVSAGSLDDAARVMSPEVVSCGSVQLSRLRSTSHGSRVIAAPSEGTRPLAFRMRSVVDIPKLSAIPSYVASVKHLLKIRGVRRAAGLSTAPNADERVKELFSDSKELPLYHQYCHRLLMDRDSLLSEPSIHIGIENITEQSQLARCATLLHALMQFKGKIDCNDFVPIVRQKQLVNLSPMQRLFGHSREIWENEDGTFEDRLHYYESVRHVVIGFKGLFFEMETIEPSGRILESSELYNRLKSFATGTTEPPCSLPVGFLTSLPRLEFNARSEEIAEHCLSNRTCFERLNSALMFVSISEQRSETGENPTVGPQDAAQWLQSTLCLTVLPNGNAVLRGSALVTDATILSGAARWVAAAANCDPMLEYRTVAPVKVEVKRQIRTPTPSAQPGKRGKAASPAKGAEEEVTQVTETITLPGPEPAAEPRLLPLWMPETYCESFKLPREICTYTVKTFELSLHEEYVLHLACLLAVHHTQPKKVPVVCTASYSAVRDPAIHLCVSTEIDSALRHVAQFVNQSGPLSAEVLKACGLAVDSLRRIVLRSPPFVSDLNTCIEQGILGSGDENFSLQQIFGPCDMMISRQEDLSPHNAIGHRGSSGIMWVLQTPLYPNEAAPFLSYFVEPAYRSSLKGSLGDLVTCSLVYRSKGEEHDEVMSKLSQLISVFARYWDDRLQALRHKQEGYLWRKATRKS